MTILRQERRKCCKPCRYTLVSSRSTVHTTRSMPTAHKAVELLASGFEVLGTFLLAVEAIKLPNLHKLRTGLFEKPLRRIVARILVMESASATEIEQLKERAETS